MPGTLVLLSAAFLLGACIVTADQSIEADPKDPRAQDIADTIMGILPHYADFPPGSPDLFVVGRTATDYLPSALQAYVSLPRAYATLHKMQNGKTADQILGEQLTLLAAKMNEVADAVQKKDSNALLANGRFLEERFGASPQALPQAAG